MLKNINPETGIRYGFIIANKVPELHDTILSCGDSLTWNGFQLELREAIETVFGSENKEEELSKLLEKYDIEYGSKREALKESLLEDIHESKNSEETIDSIAETLGDKCYSHWECVEENYEYSVNGEEYLLGYSGGAPHIWVCKSPVLTQVRPCCFFTVPNAGDLDSPDPDGGVECYAVPPEWFSEGNCEYEVYPAPAQEVA